MSSQSITVDLGERSYPILVGKKLIKDLGRQVAHLYLGDKVAILAVAIVDDLYGQAVRESLAGSGIPSETILVPDREGAKTIRTYQHVMEQFLRMKVGRGSIVIALGGGCVGDLAGFVAATYMRGVRLVQIPTTLLAQVDSSMGGKAALNLPEAKNILGAFHQPSLVLSDVSLLKTLPTREVRCGVAELIKYAAIMNLRLLEFLERERESILGLEEGAMVKAVSWATELKSGIVARDERDQSGLRALLNFGHTFGHAVEAAIKYRGLSHGEAIAVGMAGEIRLAEALGMVSKKDVRRLEALIVSYGLPIRFKGVNHRDLIRFMGHDKKAEAGKLRFALPNGLGNGTIVSDPPKKTVADALRGCV